MRGWDEQGEGRWHQTTLGTPPFSPLGSPPGTRPLLPPPPLKRCSSLHITLVKFTNKRESIAIKPPQLPHATHTRMVPLPRVSHLAPLAPIRRLTSQWPRRPGQVRGRGGFWLRRPSWDQGDQTSMRAQAVLGKGLPSCHRWFSAASTQDTVTTTASQFPLSSTVCLWAGGRTSSTLLPSPVNIWHRVFQRIKLH